MSACTRPPHTTSSAVWTSTTEPVSSLPSMLQSSASLPVHGFTQAYQHSRTSRVKTWHRISPYALISVELWGIITSPTGSTPIDATKQPAGFRLLSTHSHKLTLSHLSCIMIFVLTMILIYIFIQILPGAKLIPWTATINYLMKTVSHMKKQAG